MISIRTNKSKCFGCFMPLVLFLFFSVKAQQNPGLSLYAFHQPYANPASVGLNAESYFQLHYRNQWTQYQSTYEGAGNLGTQIASLVLALDDLNLGAGLQYVNDLTPSGAGMQFVRTQLAYHLPLGTGTLSAGANLGFSSKSFDGRVFRARESSDPFIVDLSGKTLAKTALDVGFGIMYSKPAYSVGVSMDHLNSPSFAFSDAIEKVRLNPMVTLMGMARVNLSEQFNWQPFTQVRLYQGNLVGDFGMRFQYNQFIWVGGNLRTNDSFAGMFGINALKNKLEFGYALEQTIAYQTIKAPLSHEVFVKFILPSFKFGGSKGTQAPINTPRFKIN